MSKRKVFCNTCQNETWHNVLHEVTQDNSEGSYFEQITYHLVNCCGCEGIRLQVVEVSDACDRNENGNIVPFEYVFPPKALRSKPKWIGQILWPFHVETGFANKNALMLITEIYTALYNKCNRLGMMGIRALLEHVMIQKCGDLKSFSRNMEAFRDKGYISDVQKEALETVLEAGHAVIHRAHAPSESELLAALDITENLIHSIYILETAKQEPARNVPPRA